MTAADKRNTIAPGPLVCSTVKPTPSSPHSTRVPWALAVAAVLSATLIAGCGSGSKSAIAVGSENSNASAELKQAEKSIKTSTTTTATSTSSTASVKTPTSGPLSKEPKVTPPSGPAPEKLETKELIKGKGPEAKDGDTVTVNYVGVLYKNGKVFDASWKRKEPFTFELGKGQVIEGWDKGVVGMHVGGRRELIIPSEEAYGKKGSPPTIPANSPLVFVVDLLAV
ncbi:MAG TPA: FKBP-type peptidyl-prolyl cis-trans isomerase [Solirubrobacteraceae bacterium]|jgi:peptidylprolyl isomerase